MRGQTHEPRKCSRKMKRAHSHRTRNGSEGASLCESFGHELHRGANAVSVSGVDGCLDWANPRVGIKGQHAVKREFLNPQPIQRSQSQLD
jgi:hypothetical protein